MKNIEYTLFSQPISRRTYYWLWFLCPGIALMIMLASRRVAGTGQAPTPAPSPFTPMR